ncbi:hypothetical protein D5S18_26650 [Nocardia panacis]|uniref:Uncharacterized protein n=1 Tax=Nocardia panacis TaxID=2340916 RepID=A0A3A4KBF9_9NOCA|nr:hypothetical protein [Nocardia panacis]RJO70780.1 hypothetical protein D5S18_26650 [Nocardia panacis]
MAAALPTGSSGTGDGRDIVIIDNTLEISQMSECWSSGFAREIQFQNRSKRPYLVYSGNHCTGDLVATIAPGTSATYFAWSAIGG